jgi:hypothetical protein
MDLHKILHATISTWEIAERITREDDGFDAWDYIAQKIGHKNPSTLRKMCRPKSLDNNAKLGVEESIIIMAITRDYRLLKYVARQLKAASVADTRQIDLFGQSCRTLGEAMEGEL